MTKPFRFGVQTAKAADGKAWRDQARQIEDLGYSTLWIPDHFGDQWGPIAALTAAAAAPTTLRVGALAFNTKLTAGYVGPEVAAEATAAKIRERVEWVKQAAGDRLDSLEFQCWCGFSFVNQDRQQVAEMMSPMFGLSPEDALEVPIVMAG